MPIAQSQHPNQYLVPERLALNPNTHSQGSFYPVSTRKTQPGAPSTRLPLSPQRSFYRAHSTVSNASMTNSRVDGKIQTT